MVVLADAFAKGALDKLILLILDSNKIGDVGLQALANALGNGALASLKELHLDFNQIGDVGMSALADAVSKGGLDHLTVYWRPTALSPCLRLGIHTLLTETFCLMCHMQELSLYNNKISDAGLTALAKAVESGALPQLEKLWLGGNSIGDVGLSALADVVALDQLQVCCRPSAL